MARWAFPHTDLTKLPTSRLRVRHNSVDGPSERGPAADATVVQTEQWPLDG
jgi:hypothetical protein